MHEYSLRLKDFVVYLQSSYPIPYDTLVLKKRSEIKKKKKNEIEDKRRNENERGRMKRGKKGGRKDKEKKQGKMKEMIENDEERKEERKENEKKRRRKRDEREEKERPILTNSPPKEEFSMYVVINSDRDVVAPESLILGIKYPICRLPPFAHQLLPFLASETKKISKQPPPYPAQKE